mgnify:CR=1 FL=1
MVMKKQFSEKELFETVPVSTGCSNPCDSYDHKSGSDDDL